MPAPPIPRPWAKTNAFIAPSKRKCSTSASFRIWPIVNSTLIAGGTSIISNGPRADLEWDEKYFNWDGEKDRLPEKGDILTATGSVHLRVPLGCQAPIVGAIAPGELVHVLRAQTVADCHHWVQVKRI